MKKVVLVIGLAVASMAVNAQLYVGGSLGFSSDSETSKNAKNEKSAFTFSPEVGYYLSEKLDVGVDLSITSGQVGGQGYSEFAAAPYARYSVLQFGKFEVIGKASVGFGAFDYSKIAGGKGTKLGVNVSPILAYGLTDNWVLFTQLNCLSLNFTATTPDGGDTYTHFGFGVDANNLVNTAEKIDVAATDPIVSGIQIGFVYKF